MVQARIFFNLAEICLMSREARRVASVRTKTKCELFSLSSEDFNFVLQDYPPMREIMKKVAEARLHMVGVTDSVGNVDPQFWYVCMRIHCMNLLSF